MPPAFPADNDLDLEDFYLPTLLPLTILKLTGSLFFLREEDWRLSTNLAVGLTVYVNDPSYISYGLLKSIRLWLFIIFFFELDLTIFLTDCVPGLYRDERLLCFLSYWSSTFKFPIKCFRAVI